MRRYVLKASFGRILDLQSVDTEALLLRLRLVGSDPLVLLGTCNGSWCWGEQGEL